MLNAAINAVKTSPRDPSEKIMINASNKTMYVGDVLTSDMVLNWANIDNGEGLSLEVEIIGNPIMINKFTNQLIQAGTYTIRYTIKSVDGEGNPLNTKLDGNSPRMTVLSKDITLTILDKPTPVDPDVPVDSVVPSDPVTLTNSVVTGNTPLQTTNQVPDISKSLPYTGETNSSMLTIVGSMTLLASGAYVLNLKRKKSN